MKITMAFLKTTGSTDAAELISAYDEYADDAWGGVPDFHAEAVSEGEKVGEVRHAVVHLPDYAIEALFELPQIAVTFTQVEG